MSRKAVFTLSVAATGFTAPLIEAPPFAGISGEEIKLAAFGDKTYTKMVSEISEYGDVSLTVLDEGDSDFLLPGTIHEFTFATGYKGPDGTTIARSFVRKCSVKSVDPTTIAVDGNRRSSITIVLTPVGGDDPSAAAPAGGFGKGTAGGGT